MDSTADFISGLVARRSTRNVNSCLVSCDSSFATRAFSVITGDLMMSQTVLITQPPPSFSWPPASPFFPRAPPLSLPAFGGKRRRRLSNENGLGHHQVAG